MDIQKLFTNLGFQANLAKYIVNPEDESIPEDFDVDKEYKEWEESQKAVWMNRLKPDIEGQVSEKLDRAIRTKAKGFVDAFGLDITKTEAFEKGFEGVLEIAKEAVGEKLKSAGKQSNEQITADRDKWKARAKSLEEEIPDLKQQFQTELETVKNSAQMEIHQSKLKDVYSQKFKNLDYGVKKGTISLFEEAAIKRINDKYNVELDGSVFSKDGKQALSFDGKRTYRTVDEAIADLAEESEVLKKSNIPPNKGKAEGGSGGSGEEGAATRRMREKFAAAKRSKFSQAN